MDALDPPTLALGLMTVGTYLLRAVPLALVSRLTLPPAVDFWLRCAAEGVLAAFITLLFFWDGGEQVPLIRFDHLVAGTVVVSVHLWRGNVLHSVLAGTVSYGLIAGLTH